MTVSSTTSKATYSGNGATTVFAVPFYFLANSHLTVVLRSSAGVETTQTLGVNYSVTGAGVQTGGSVTMFVAPPSGSILTIARNVPTTQETDFLPNDKLPAESLEATVDKLTMIAQQIAEDANRSIKAPISETPATELFIPSIADRADKFFAFDVNGFPQARAVGPGGGDSSNITFLQAGTGATVRTVQSKLRETVSVTDFGAVGDWNGTTGADNTTAFNNAIAAVQEGGTLNIPPGNYLISGSVILDNKNINIFCEGTLFFTQETSSRLLFRSTTAGSNVISVPGSQLSPLPLIGNRKLNWSVAPSVTDPSQYFAVMFSTEPEITRIGSATYVPYDKRETLDVCAFGWELTSPVKLDYTDASKLTVFLVKKRRPVTVSGLRMVFVNLTGSTAVKSAILSLSRVSNITFENLEVTFDPAPTSGAVAINTIECCALTFNSCVSTGPAGTGDTYPFLNSVSAFLSFNYCENKVPVNNANKINRYYIARHGSDVTFYRCRTNGIDDHYGHNYVVEECHFSTRAVGFAGGNLKIKNCIMAGIFRGEGLLTFRSDTPYAYGNLEIDGCTVRGGAPILLMRNESDPLNRPTKMKFFDEIHITNTTYEGDSTDPAFRIYKRDFGVVDNFEKTRLFSINNFTFNRNTASIGCAFFALETGQNSARWVETVEFFDVRYNPLVVNPSGSYGERTIVTVRDLWADRMIVDNCYNFVPYLNNVDSVTVSNSVVGIEYGDIAIAQGDYVFDNCKILNPIVTAAPKTATFEFTNCTFDANVYGTGTSGSDVSSATKFLSRNRATPSVDLTNVPAGGLEYYINPTYYKTS